MIVTVGIPPRRSTVALAQTIDQRVEETTGRDIEIQVRYVTVENG